LRSTHRFDCPATYEILPPENGFRNELRWRLRRHNAQSKQG
jgi:hypothetical protein